MRYGVISDIHSNLEGFQAALAAVEEAEVDTILCCGDIIGYNANPNECVDLVRERKIRCIRGNHERGLEDLLEGRVPNMNPMAMEALHFTRESLSGDRLEWLVALPDELSIEDVFYLFHGSPSDPDEYIFDKFEAAYAMKFLVYERPSPANLCCFIGHTHVCAAYFFDTENQRVGEKMVQDGDSFKIIPGAHYMFNAGSCGQYRGGAAVATLAIIDTTDMKVDFHFRDYDYRSAQDKVIKAGLPPFLAERLALGQ